MEIAAPLTVDQTIPSAEERIPCYGVTKSNRGHIMQVSPQVVHAFDLCLDAVIGLTDWPSALQHLGRSLGADSSVMMSSSQDFTTRHRLQIESTEHAGFSDLWLARLEDPLDDPHSTRGCRYPIASQPCIIEHNITSDQERAALPYFNEVARPGKRDWWALLRTETARGAWCLNLYRGARGGPYGPEDALRIAEAAPLLRRLTATAECFAQTGWNSRLHSFDQLRLAAFLIDRSAHVQGMNQAAESLLGQGLSMYRGRLCATERRAQTALARFLGLIAVGNVPPGHIMLPQEDDRCWLVEFVPVTERATEVFSGAKGLILVSDLSGRRALKPGLLQMAYGVTPAEERLALAFADCWHLCLAAERLGISHETARSHLRAVFEKTGTHSQAELTALLTRFAERTLSRSPPPNG